MSAYTRAGDIFAPAGGIKFKTKTSILWEVGRPGSGWWFIVAPGAVFDVSVPRPLRWLFNPTDRRFLKAAALHDELLRLGYDRIFAASVFHAALKADGVSAPLRLAMLLAVIVYRYA